MADDDETSPAELDDVQLLIFRTQVRYQIAHDPANVSAELSSRYRALNDELDKRIRGCWS